MVAPPHAPTPALDTSPASSHRAANPAPPTLIPRDGKLFVVRWIRRNGKVTDQRYFRRRSDARLYAAKLELVGRCTAIFATHVEWEPAGEPDPVDFRIARERLR